METNEINPTISGVTFEVKQEGKIYSLTLTELASDMVDDPDLLAGTLTRLLYRKLQVFKAAGKSPISLNRRSEFQIVVTYEGSSEGKKIFNVSERLNIYNVGRLYREYEAKLANYLRLIISDATSPIAQIRASELLSTPILPAKQA